MENISSIEELTIERAKKRAKRLKNGLEALGVRIKHMQALDLIARMYNYRDWNVFSAIVTRNEMGGNRGGAFVDDLSRQAEKTMLTRTCS